MSDAHHTTHEGVVAIRRRVAPILFALALVLSLAAPAVAIEDVTPARVEGPNRVATAAAVADLAHPEGTARAVIATSVTAADALAATPLAGALDAALLLTRPDELPTETAQALQGLGVTEVTLVGGTQAISQAVSDTLQQDYEVARISGDREWDTAARTAEQVVAAAGLPQLSQGSTVFLANGERFPDALSSSAAAYEGPVPVLYTTRDTLHPEVTQFLDQHAVDHVVLLGGVDAIGADVEAALSARGHVTTRLAGPTRVETSTQVATWTAQQFGFDLSTTILARGDDFPDALTSGQLGGAANAPIVLSATPTVLPSTAEAWLADHCPTLEVVQAVGGEAAISVAVLDQAVAAAESCATPPTEDGPTFGVSPQEAVEVAPEATFQFEVFARYDDQPFTGPVDIVLFPCANVDVLGRGTDTFADADGDGAADGFGSTDSGAARIALVNGADVEDTAVVVGAQPGADGNLSFTMYSASVDCAVPVVIDGDGDGDFDVDAQGRPAEPYGLGVISWTDTAPDGTQQTFIVDPQQPRSGPVASTHEFGVGARYDEQPFTGPVDIVLFPCINADVLGGGEQTFADGDGDGAADGFGTTDNGFARIALVNGEDIADTTVVVGAEPDTDGVLRFTLYAAEPDCTVPVVINGDGDGDFDVDGEGRPIEPYGVGYAEWGTF